MVKMVVLGLVSGLVVAALVLFEPWRAFTDSTLEEPAPVAAAVDLDPGSSTPPPTSPDASPDPLVLPDPPPMRVEVGGGDFEDAEHATAGRARVVEVGDGSRYVRLEGLDTSDGPDLHVWLSDAPSGGDWGSYNDAEHVDLGGLKANRGSHNYEIPVDADLSGMRSVVIWCDRFDVAFGTAPVSVL